MIIGAHSIIYSKSPEADRTLLREVFELPYVDVGDGWLIFGLPPAELAVHPSEKNDVHEFFLMCDDIDAFGEAGRHVRTGARPRVGAAGAGDVTGWREARCLPAAARAAEARGSGEEVTEDDPTFEEATPPVNGATVVPSCAGDVVLNDDARQRGGARCLSAIC